MNIVDQYKSSVYGCSTRANNTKAIASFWYCIKCKDHTRVEMFNAGTSNGEEMRIQAKQEEKDTVIQLNKSNTQQIS